MKFLLVFVALFAVALAAPNSEGDAYIVKYDSDNIGVEGYNFAFETSNGISQYAAGDASSVRGGFKYTDPEGQVHEVKFVSDENGYQPEGADIQV